jgi:hypothetical protein
MAPPMIRFAWFPDARHAPEWGERVIEIFRRHDKEISSAGRDRALTSEEVLQALAPDLRQAGFVIERRKLAAQSGGFLGSPSALVRDQFDVFHPEWLCCLAIEEGLRGPVNEADGARVEPLLVVDIDTLCLALPNAPAARSDEQQADVTDYDSACALATTVYGHTRVKLPYRLLLVGY